MKYSMLLWPHANARYQNETMKLAAKELRLMLTAFSLEADVKPSGQANLPALEIETEKPFDEFVLNAIRAHSLLYALFAGSADGAMELLAVRETAYLGNDLPGILKYKGKTNELFLQLLINVALYSGSYALSAQDRLELLDPMCGRGTALYVGANRGWNTTGTDVDRADLSEAEKFLKRYFEYHRFKHAIKRSSRTIQDDKPAQMTQFTFSDTAEHYKAGDVSSLCLAHANAVKTREVFGAGRFHVIVSDLPYGVQHGAVGGSPEVLLTRALPGWRAALKTGGCVAVSFNAQTLKREKVWELMDQAGLEALRGEEYSGFDHWVEQAVTRDIAVGRRKK